MIQTLLETDPAADTDPESRLDFLDLFCGGGGSGTGSLEALELLGTRPRGIFVNHWDKAIQIHSHNHPEHQHFCTGVDDVSPEELYKSKGKKLRFLWGSPECTHHSSARGGKPMSEQSRATAQCLVRWIRHERPYWVLVENVPEFRDWGPLRQKRTKDHKRVWVRILRWTTTRGNIKERRTETTEVPPDLIHKPKFMSEPEWLKRLSDAGYEMALTADKRKKGQIFKAWVRKIRKLGYHVEHRVLCAADYGDPTSRRRVFVQAVRTDIGRNIWPKITHVKRDKVTGDFTKGMLPYRTARDIIDWTDKGDSIFTRPKHLVEKTMKRIGIGFKKIVIPAIVQAILDGSIWQRAEDFIVPQQQGGAPVKSADDPVSPVTTKSCEMVVQPEISGAIIQQQGQSTAQTADAPVSSMTTGQHHGVLQAEPYIIPQQSFDERVRNIDQPGPTVTCDSRGIGLAQPMPSFQVPLEGVMGGNAPRSIDSPVPAVTASHGGGYIARPFLVKFQGTSTVKLVDDPLDSVSCGGNAAGIHFANAIMEAFQMSIDHQSNATGGVAPMSDPVRSVVTENNQAVAVTAATAFIHSSDHRSHCGDAVHPITDPMPAILTKVKENLVVTDPVFVVETAHGEDHRDEGRRVQSPDNPMGAIQAGGTNQGIVSQETSFIVPNFGEAEGQTPRTHSINDPVPAATSHGAGALVTGESGRFEDGVGVLVPYEHAFLIQTAHTGCDDSRVRALLEPLAAVAGNRGDMALIRPWIYVYYSSGSVGSEIDQPIPTIRTHDAVGVCYPAVEIQGNILVFDIFFRMLKVRELARAQGFHDDFDFPVNKTEAVRAIGNAVPRSLARALVLACVGQDEDVMSRIKNTPEIREQIEAHYTPEEALEYFGPIQAAA